MGEESEKKADKKEPETADVPKKPRGRKKLQYQTLRKQMEFYFSAANLSKDRFLGQLLKETEYVDLDVFLNFNKIRKLTSNIKDIANALQSSDLLKLSECGTKVYRVKPLESKSNAEECTIYVENIPAKADHDFLTEIFSCYGEIDYVSIPRYKHSKMNKGFAFIEFKEPESVEKAVTAFKGFGSHLLDKIEPAQLCSIKTFNEEKELEKAENCGTHKRFDEDENPFSEDDNNDNKNNETVLPDKNSTNEEEKDEEEGKLDKKRRKVNLETESDDGPKAKKTKMELSDSVSSSCKSKRKMSTGSDQETGSETENIKHRKAESGDEQRIKKKKRKAESGDENESDKKERKKRSLTGGDDESDVVKIRKHEEDESHTEKNKNEEDCLPNQEKPETDDHLAQESSNNEDEVDDFDTDKKKRNRKKRKKSKREKACSGLQILTKKEWKVMRNRYLTEQRKRMSNLKKHLVQKRWEYYNSTKEDQMQENDDTEEKQEDNSQNEKSSDVRVSYQAGVIVKIVFDEPIADKDSFKNELKRKPEIKYIDVKECSTIAHLRFASSDAAQLFAQNSTWQGTTLLEGCEEQDYWEKVWKDRENKINKNIRKPKNGRKKLLEKAENMRAKHIRFD